LSVLIYQLLFLFILGNCKPENISEEDLMKITKRLALERNEIFLRSKNFSNKVMQDKKEKDEEAYSELADNTNCCIRKVLRILDFGMDKSFDSFYEDLYNATFS